MADNNSLDTKILIADDDPNVLDFLKLFLKFKGYRDVRSADNGRDALEAVKKEDLRLVLLDIMLPDLNGVEVLRQVKEAKPDVSVIMITGYPDEEKARELLKKSRTFGSSSAIRILVSKELFSSIRIPPYKKLN